MEWPFERPRRFERWCFPVQREAGAARHRRKSAPLEIKGCGTHDPRYLVLGALTGVYTPLAWSLQDGKRKSYAPPGDSNGRFESPQANFCQASCRGGWRNNNRTII